MTPWRSGILASRAVLLGDSLACDGFARDAAVRVQTHVHDDHMLGFETSLGLQRVLALPGTRELLIHEINGTLHRRTNFDPLTPGEVLEVEGGSVRLLDSGHMLGSAQVEYTCADEYRIGYSGDFAWPLDDVMSVDELVVDSTYGSPGSQRRYSQVEAEDLFVDRVLQHVVSGPVYVRAWRGTLQRALAALGDCVHYPLLASAAQVAEAVLYRQHGFGICDIVDAASEEGKAALADGRYVLFEGRGDRPKMNRPKGYSIQLSAFHARPQSPLMEYSPSDCAIAISNHADFDGTLEYVAATGAQRVVTDNVRGPHGVDLAIELVERLGIDARPGSAMSGPRDWGT